MYCKSRRFENSNGWLGLGTNDPSVLKIIQWEGGGAGIKAPGWLTKRMMREKGKKKELRGETDHGVY